MDTVVHVETDKERDRVDILSSRRGHLRVTWVTPETCRLQYAREGRFSPAALNRYFERNPQCACYDPTQQRLPARTPGEPDLPMMRVMR